MTTPYVEKATGACLFSEPSQPSTSFLDVLIPLWPHLDAYEQLSVRQCCREGLRVHDNLLTALSVHDLWGRVLPDKPHEIRASLWRMVARGCRPRSLTLRLRGGSAVTRLARGLAVLGVLAGGGAGDADSDADSSSGGGSGDAASGSSGISRGSGGARQLSAALAACLNGPPLLYGNHSCAEPYGGSALATVRLEGVPLTARVVNLLAAAMPGPASLKLYGYDIRARHLPCRDPSPHSPQQSEPWSPQWPGLQHESSAQRSQPRDGASYRSTAPVISDAGGRAESRGVPALLRALAPQLTGLTLQDCVAAAAAGASGGGRDGTAPDGRDGNQQLPYNGTALAPMLGALRGCLRLQHLGLRHSEGCPLLPLLLQPGLCLPLQLGESWPSEGHLRSQERAASAPSEPQLAAGAAAATSTAANTAASPSRIRSSGGVGADRGGLGDRHPDGGVGGRDSGVGADGSRDGSGGRRRTTCPVSSPPLLAALRSLSSLKLQTPLPVDVRQHLMAALDCLTGLTRLELGNRAAVRSLAEILPLSMLAVRQLRDLDVSGAHVASAAEMEALAALTALTRLSLGAVLVQPAEATATALLPPQLQELSVASPLPPATLLALRLPPSLHTLRTTGFSLSTRDAAEERFAAQGAAGAAAASSDSLLMLPTSYDALSLSVLQLPGRFAYRDLGIELHVGFHGATTGCRRYLAAPPSRPVGHGRWIAHLAPLALQGLELAGLELRNEDVAVVARQLGSLEDLRLDCRYPPPSLPRLSALRRLRRLLLNASFWQLRQQDRQGHPPRHQHQHQHQQQLQQDEARGGEELEGEGRNRGLRPAAPHPTAAQEGQGPAHSSQELQRAQRAQHGDEAYAEVAAAALTRLCTTAPDCLYDIALASNGRVSARFAAMLAVVWVEDALPRVGCGALRMWVCP